MPLAFYLDFATKQEGLRRFIDSKGLLTPRIGSLSCRPLPPSDNKGRDLAVIKQILHGYILSERKIRVPHVSFMPFTTLTNPYSPILSQNTKPVATTPGRFRLNFWNQAKVAVPLHRQSDKTSSGRRKQIINNIIISKI